MTGSVAIVGLACSEFGADRDVMLDELVFDVSYRALRDAGLRKQDVGLSVQCSADIYDARSYSGGLVAPAAAGYLSQEGRVEGDAMTGLITAIAAILSRQVETALVVAYFRPEVAVAGLAAFTEQVSSYDFDPHLARPIGLSASAVLAMHANAAVAAGEITTAELAARTAEEIAAGAAGRRTVRSRPYTPRQVQEACEVAWPLTEPMLPALTTGAIALVLTGRGRAPRCRQVHGRITGWGSATNPAAFSIGWLQDPGSATRRAAAKAYRLAGIDDVAEQVDHVELTALTPALHGPVMRALAVADDHDRVNRSGGVRSCFPGLANGALRIVEALEALGRRPGRAVAHSMDNLTGPPGSDAGVLVIETC